MRACFRCTGLLWLSTLTVAGQTDAQLRTADTAIQLEAGASAPRLVTFSFPGQMSWTNVLPDSQSSELFFFEEKR